MFQPCLLINVRHSLNAAVLFCLLCIYPTAAYSAQCDEENIKTAKDLLLHARDDGYPPESIRWIMETGTNGTPVNCLQFALCQSWSAFHNGWHWLDEPEFYAHLRENYTQTLSVYANEANTLPDTFAGSVQVGDVFVFAGSDITPGFKS